MSATLGAQLEARVRQELPSLDDAQAREVASIVEQLAALLRPERIYAFGSRARDDAGPDSDVDLLVVVSTSDEPGYQREQRARLALRRDFTVGLDLLIWTRSEFDRRAPNPATLSGTVLREGKALYAP